MPYFGAKVGSALFTYFAEANVIHIPLTSSSGATPANLLMASITASHFPTCTFQKRLELARDQTGNHPHRRRTVVYFYSSRLNSRCVVSQLDLRTEVGLALLLKPPPYGREH